MWPIALAVVLAAAVLLLLLALLLLRCRGVLALEPFCSRVPVLWPRHKEDMVANLNTRILNLIKLFR